MWAMAWSGVNGLVETARRAAGLCPCCSSGAARATRASRSGTGPAPTTEPLAPAPAGPDPTTLPTGWVVPRTADEPPTGPAPGPGPGDEVALEAGGEVPPGPWRWRWVWPTPGRSAGMALVASDGTLVLWSPGGFATPGEPPDGRPTPDIAAALASIPDLATTAAGAESLRGELDRARTVASETRRLLDRAAGAVDDEIDRVHSGETGAPPDDRPTPTDR